MKTQNYGVYITKYRRQHLPVTATSRQVDAKNDYKRQRINGDFKQDSPQKSLPEDGKITWVKGEVKGNSVDGGVKESDGNYHFECRYDEGAGDRKWMEECDRNYLARLHLDGAKTDQEHQDLAVNRDRAARAATEVAKLPTEQLSNWLYNSEALRKLRGTRSASPKEAEEKRSKDLEAQKKAQEEKARSDKLIALRLQVAQKEKEAAEAKKKRAEEEEIRQLEEKLHQQSVEEIFPPPPSESEVTPAIQAASHSAAYSSAASVTSGSSSGSIKVSAEEAKDMQKNYLIDYGTLTFGKLLGEGGFGAVYKGTYRLGDVAIKKLLMKKMTSACEEEFKNETGVMAKLKHPNIVQIHGYTISPSYCIVMELMHTSLFSVLQNNAVELPWSNREVIAKDIIAGLWQLHESGILHRDLKSLNVLLSSTMRAKLADFGLSKVKSETKTTTKTTESSVGTVQWMAPELFGLKPKYSRASDVFAYAMVLWEIVARQVPYADANPQVVISEVRQGAREEIPEDCPKKFASLIKFCWLQDASKRPTAREIGTFLQSDTKEFKPTTTEAAATQYRDNLDSQVLSNLNSLRS